MNWGEPAWLWLLVGWTGLVLWVCTRSGQRTLIPFSALWAADVAVPQGRRRIHLPPLAIALLLGAIGAGILAGAGPVLAIKTKWLIAARQPAAALVILDCGMSFAADAPYPYANIAAAASDLFRQSPDISVDLWPVPGTRYRIPADQLGAQINLQRPTIRASEAALNSAVRLAADGSDILAIIVLSDRQIARPIGLRPDIPFCRLPVSHVDQKSWIVTAGARSEPRPQVMVRIAWVGNPGVGSLRITSGGKTTSEDVTLIGQAGLTEKAFFLDVPELGETALCQINGDGPLESFYLVRENGWPTVRLASNNLPEGVAKFVDIYREDRPPTAESRQVIVASEFPALGPAPGLVCVTLRPAGAQGAVAGVLAVSEHPVTRGLDFSALAATPAGAPSSAGQLPVGFSGLVWIGDSPVIAAGQNPRRIWIGLTAAQWHAWASDTGFVHFWARAMSWCAERVGAADVYSGPELPPIPAYGWLDDSLNMRQFQPPTRNGLGEAIARFYPMYWQLPVTFNADRPPLPSPVGVVPPLLLRARPTGSDLQPLLAAAGVLLAACGIFIGVAPPARRGS